RSLAKLRFRVLPLSSALHRSSACLLSVISPSGVCKLPRSAYEKRPKPSPSWRTPSAMTLKRHLAGHSSANSGYRLLDGESKDDRTRSWIRDTPGQFRLLGKFSSILAQSVTHFVASISMPPRRRGSGIDEPVRARSPALFRMRSLRFD